MKELHLEDDRIDELSSILDKLKKENEYEKKKVSKLVKENSSLKKEMSEIEAQTEGDNDPETLKKRMSEMANKLTEANRQNRDRKVKISTLEEELSDSEVTLKEVFTYISKQVSLVSDFVQSTQSTEINSELSRGSIQIPDIMKKGSESKKGSDIVKQIESLKDELRNSHSQTLGLAKEYQDRVGYLEGEIVETKHYKKEIKQDFKRLREDIEEREQAILEMTQCKDDAEDELTEIKNELLGVSRKLETSNRDLNDILQEVIFQLHALKQKYDTHPLATTQSPESSLLRELNFEVEDPQKCREKTPSEKRAVIQQLLSKVSDLMNSFCFA